MNDSEVARLRVAQATREPRTAATIEELLDADEAVASLTVPEVEDTLEEWVAAGVVERIEGEGEDEPARYVLTAWRLFPTDLDRRVAANLSQPRNLEGLQALLRSDPLVGSLSLASLARRLGELADRGLVKMIGEHPDPGDLVEAVQGDDDVIDLHADKAKALAARLAKPARAWQLAGEQWVMTRAALDALRVT